MIVCVVLMRIADHVTRRDSKVQAKQAGEKLAAGPNGFKMVLSDRYLTLMAALVVLLNVVNTSGEYLFGRYVVEAANATYGSGPEGAIGTAALHRRDLRQLLHAIST